MQLLIGRLVKIPTSSRSDHFITSYFKASRSCCSRKLKAKSFDLLEHCWFSVTWITYHKPKPTSQSHTRGAMIQSLTDLISRLFFFLRGDKIQAIRSLSGRQRSRRPFKGRTNLQHTTGCRFRSVPPLICRRAGSTERQQTPTQQLKDINNVLTLSHKKKELVFCS